jgi:hypothetical protein
VKWVALVLLLVNGLVWYAGDFWLPGPTSTVVSGQSLPRVATLKVTEPPEEPQSETMVEPVLQLCVRLGWFETSGQALDAYNSLGRPGTDYAVLEQERTLEPLHWVIIPPQPEDRALALFSGLQRRGIDSYLVTEGENRNAISLGLFQSREAAERVLEAKNRQNLNAILANFPRNQLSYALVFEVSPVGDENTGGRRVSDYQDDFEMVEISRCEGIATNPENP